MSSPFVWFHHNGQKAKKTNAFYESLFSWKGSPQALVGHRKLQAEAAARKELRAVARLDAPGTSRTIRARATGHDVSDGPFIETKEWLVGFYLVDCETEEQAIARGKQICADPHHVIEVRPVDWAWRP